MSLATTCVNGVCTCLLPIEANDFRPLALRHRSLAFVSALLVAVKVVTLLAVAITPTPAELSTITVARVVQLTNAERQKAGQSPLTVNSKLAAAAQRKGEDMLAHDYFAHISPSGVTPWFWMQQQDYAYAIAGENLAIDFVEVEDVVAAWIASPSHRDNMLHSAYTETGVAVVTGEFQGGTSTVVVHMFGLPAGNPSSEAPQSGAKLDSTKKPPATAGTKQTAPSATPTPTPSPTPAPIPPADTTPPRTPRIAVVNTTSSVVATSVTVTADTEEGSSVRFLVNNVEVTRVTGESPTATLDLGQFADGELQVEAVAEDTAGNTSSRSNAVRLHKDSTAPALAEAGVSFLLGPETDVPVVLASITSKEVAHVRVQEQNGWQAVPLTGPLVVPLHGGPTALALTDTVGNSSEPLMLALLPTYTVAADTDFIASPSRFSRVSRWFIAGVLALITLLLALAVFVRVSIQRPTLIAHASAVMVLAMVFLFF